MTSTMKLLRTGNSRQALLVCQVAIALALGSVGTGLSQNSKTPPFKPQKNGGISMKDVIMLTKQPPGKDRITDGELQRIKDSNPIRYSRAFKDNSGKFTPPRGDFYANSKIIGFEGGHTVVPETAILFVPDPLKHHILKSPTGKLVFWPQFLKDNYIWIQPYEVSLETAKGETPLSENMQQDVARTGRIVVATYKGFPISVLLRPLDTTKSNRSN